MSAITYPVTVDYKKLWALIHTGDAIIRNPKMDRIAKWAGLRAVLAKQCNQPQPATPQRKPRKGRRG